MLCLEINCLGDMEVFVWVVDFGSFLGVVCVFWMMLLVVSKFIVRFEVCFGVCFVNRSTRNV